ncbi:MAG: prepilin peptidase [Rhodobacteraceae bacterium]|nr:prepilin peptidase [Paracoccaceae bacterium]
MTLALSIAAILLFLWAGLSDIATRRIPNRLVALLALAALGRLGLEVAGGAGLLQPAADLALGLAVFAFGALLFHFGLFGGGDVKLLAAGALWIGAGSAWPFLAGTALAGGVLALGFVLWLAFARRGGARPSLPYGVAIAAGGVIGTLATL